MSQIPVLIETSFADAITIIAAADAKSPALVDILAADRQGVGQGSRLSPPATARFEPISASCTTRPRA